MVAKNILFLRAISFCLLLGLAISYRVALLSFLAESNECLLHSLAVIIEELDALGTDVKLVVSDTVEQELHEICLVHLQKLYFDRLHPVEEHVVKLGAHILRPIIHREPELLHSEALEERLGALARQHVLKAGQSGLAHLRVLMLQVADEALDGRSEVRSDPLAERECQAAGKLCSLDLHLGVGIGGSTAKRSANDTKMRHESLLVGLEALLQEFKDLNANFLGYKKIKD